MHVVSIARLNKFLTHIKAIFATKEEVEALVGGGVSHNTSFGSDGSITTSYVNGDSETTEFLSDGSIVTKSYKNGVLAKTETTVFNADGTVSTTYTKGSGN